MDEGFAAKQTTSGSLALLRRGEPSHLSFNERRLQAHGAIFASALRRAAGPRSKPGADFIKIPSDPIFPELNRFREAELSNAPGKGHAIWHDSLVFQEAVIYEGHLILVATCELCNDD
jgi:hypothetical protein